MEWSDERCMCSHRQGLVSSAYTWYGRPFIRKHSMAAATASYTHTHAHARAHTHTHTHPAHAPCTRTRTHLAGLRRYLGGLILVQVGDPSTRVQLLIGTVIGRHDDGRGTWGHVCGCVGWAEGV